MASGAGTDEVFKPTWFAYQKMAGFLKPVYQARYTTDTEGGDEGGDEGGGTRGGRGGDEGGTRREGGGGGC
ncbi:hypothetical protein JTB14_004210 [Gonioctena quinquepunctata]|nr:hypothetical protein JTB14_004210 [Gonioctena quinquepunctata]